MFPQKIKNTLVVITLLIYIFNFSPLFAQGMPSPVKVSIVQGKNSEERRLVTGNLEIIKKSTVASQEAGLVIKAEVQEGQKVAKGAVLIELDATRLKIELEQAKLQSQKALNYLNQKDIELKDLTDELSRLIKAEKQSTGSTSQLEVQKIQKNLEVTKSNRLSAEQDHKSSLLKEALIETRIKDMTVIAPFDGVVIKKIIEVGEWVNPGTPIISLNATGSFKVKLEIPETVSPHELKTITSLEVTVSGNPKPYNVAQIQVIPEINTRSRVYLLTGFIKDEQNIFASGQSIQAYIPVNQKRDYLVIPTDAVIKDAGGNFVYKIIANEKGAMALPANITILFLEGNSYFTESSSLKVGDQIVIEGNERLRPMAPVSILPESKK